MPCAALTATTVVCVAWLVGATVALPAFRSLIPNGHSVTYNGAPWPAVGHESVAGGPMLNLFGAAFRANRFEWSPALCRADSDGDGFTNGEELGDPSCLFTPANASASARDLWTIVSHPGFNDSIPVRSVTETMNAFDSMLLGVTNFTRAFAAVNGTLWGWRKADGSPACARVAARPGRFACNLTLDWSSGFHDSAHARGTLAAELVASAWVEGLESAVLSNQQLRGQLNLTLLGSDVPIRHIDLRNNSLTGAVDLRNLPRTLEYLDLSLNGLSGALDLSNASLVLHPGLRTLRLEGNAFDEVTLGSPGGFPPGLIVALPDPAELPGGTYRYVCGARHPAVVFVDQSGRVVSSLAPSEVPVACRPQPGSAAGCVEGAVYLVTSGGQQCTAATLGVSPPPQYSTATVTVRSADAIHNYCDVGCSVVLSLLIVFLVAVLLFVIVLKCLIHVDPDPTGQSLYDGDPRRTSFIQSEKRRTRYFSGMADSSDARNPPTSASPGGLAGRSGQRTGRGGAREETVETTTTTTTVTRNAAGAGGGNVAAASMPVNDPYTDSPVDDGAGEGAARAGPSSASTLAPPPPPPATSNDDVEPVNLRSTSGSGSPNERRHTPSESLVPKVPPSSAPPPPPPPPPPALPPH